MTLHWNILDEPRRLFIKELEFLSSQFYLAGGTALALQKGHRDSVDFDFFSLNPFAPDELLKEVTEQLPSHTILVTQSTSNTLGLLVDNSIRLSFLTYPYELCAPLVDAGSIKLASVIDIGCMKLSAITSRSTFKDYIDLYVILHETNLASLLNLAAIKFPAIDSNVILKSMVYFDDITNEPIAFQLGFTVTIPQVQIFLSQAVKQYHEPS